MISFTDGGLIDVWPDKESPQIQALSYAMQQAMIRVKSYADQAMCYSMVDDLPEDILDYFAVEMRAMYYEQYLEIEKKREIVKNTLKWYTYAGTPATVTEMVSAIFGDGRIVEWFNYDEPPYTPGTFDIETSGRLTEETFDQISTLIKKAKNARSQIRRVIIIRDVHALTSVAATHTAVQECTVLNIIREDKDAGTEKYAAEAAYTSHDSFILNTVNDDVEAESGQSIVVYSTTSGGDTFITDEVNGDASASMTGNASIHGSIYNTTTFIKEES